VLSWQTTHLVGAKKHRKSTKPESHQTAKMYFFLSSSSHGLVQICVTLSRWFSHKTAAFPLSSAPAYRFFPGLILTRELKLLTEEQWLPL